jgi:hypothetical protein
MNKNLEFKAIAKEVDAWRKNKTNRNSKMPEQLVSAIKNLGEQYKPGQIASLLEMSHSTVHKIMGKEQKKTQFVEMPTFKTPSLFNCILHRLDGSKLIIEVQNQQITDLIEAFLCSK